MQAHFIFCNRIDQLKKIKRACMPPQSDSEWFVLTSTDIALNVNRFVQSVCELRSETLRGESSTAANRKLSEILKKGGLVVNQTVVLLMKCVQAKKNATEESGRKVYLFVAFFLTNIRASNPPFLKLRQALMRYAKLFGDSASPNISASIRQFFVNNFSLT